jgi:hypothetical protein
MLMSKYRFDNRSPEEFKKHIKECTKLERELMEKYVKWLNSSNKGNYTFIDNGVDNTGEFIVNDKHLSSKADFILYKNNGRPRKIEIKHCKPECTRFHIKLSHIYRCIKEDVCIVNWMGVGGKNPRFCVLTPKILEESLKRDTVQMWQKETIRFYCSEFDWTNDAN